MKVASFSRHNSSFLNQNSSFGPHFLGHRWRQLREHLRLVKARARRCVVKKSTFVNRKSRFLMAQIRILDQEIRILLLKSHHTGSPWSAWRVSARVCWSLCSAGTPAAPRAAASPSLPVASGPSPHCSPIRWSSRTSSTQRSPRTSRTNARCVSAVRCHRSQPSTASWSTLVFALKSPF